MPLSKAMASALAALKLLKRGDREVTAAEVRKAMNVEAALRRRREHDEDGGRERDERCH